MAFPKNIQGNCTKIFDFSEVTDPRVTGRSLHLLSDILMIGLCTYLTGGTDYERLDRRRQPTGFRGLVPVIPAIQINKCGNVALITKLFPDIFCNLRDKFYVCNQ